MGVWLRRFWPLPLLLSLQLGFMLLPQIDLFASAFFYRAPQGFLFDDKPAVQAIDALFTYLYLLLLLVLHLKLLLTLMLRKLHLKH